MTVEEPSLYTEALELAGGDMERLAREALGQLEAARVDLLTLREENGMLRELLERLASPEISAPRGRPKKIRLGITRTNKVVRGPGRPASNKLPVKNNTVLHHALSRQETRGGALIDIIRKIIGSISEQANLDLSQDAIRAIAETIAKKNKARSHQPAIELGSNWVSRGLGYVSPISGEM